MKVNCTAKTATKFQGCTGTPATVFPVPVTNGYSTPANTGTIGGFIKIEMQNNAGAWSDVTLEVLNHGFASANMRIGGGCGDPNPDAIIRLERIADMPANNGPCGMTAGTTTAARDFWPLALFDTREALQRDTAPGGGAIILGGVMSLRRARRPEPDAMDPGCGQLRAAAADRSPTTPTAPATPCIFQIGGTIGTPRPGKRAKTASRTSSTHSIRTACRTARWTPRKI